MDVEAQTRYGMDEVGKLVKDIGVGMLTTRDAQGDLVSRPMAALEMDKDGSLWFFTSASSSKTHQLDRVNLSFADIDEAVYISLSGSGEMVEDREIIEELWSPAAKPWFPNGPQDPDLALLRVDVKNAEIWDGNASKMVRMLAMAAAVVTGQPNAVLTGKHTVVGGRH
jgi:general stress protein 26